MSTALMKLILVLAGLSSTVTIAGAMEDLISTVDADCANSAVTSFALLQKLMSNRTSLQLPIGKGAATVAMTPHGSGDDQNKLPAMNQVQPTRKPWRSNKEIMDDYVRDGDDGQQVKQTDGDGSQQVKEDDECKDKEGLEKAKCSIKDIKKVQEIAFFFALILLCPALLSYFLWHYRFRIRRDSQKSNRIFETICKYILMLLLFLLGLWKWLLCGEDNGSGKTSYWPYIIAPMIVSFAPGVVDFSVYWHKGRNPQNQEVKPKPKLSAESRYEDLSESFGMVLFYFAAQSILFSLFTVSTISNVIEGVQTISKASGVQTISKASGIASGEASAKHWFISFVLTVILSVLIKDQMGLSFSDRLPKWQSLLYYNRYQKEDAPNKGGGFNGPGGGASGGASGGAKNWLKYSAVEIWMRIYMDFLANHIYLNSMLVIFPFFMAGESTMMEFVKDLFAITFITTLDDLREEDYDCCFDLEFQTETLD